MPKDLSITMADRPGTLADAAEAIGGAGINIRGGCGVTAAGQGVLHVLVDDAEIARGALEGAGMTAVEERDVLVTRVTDQPGELGRFARRLAEAGVNLQLLYLTTGGELVVGADDLEAARKALGQ